MLKELAKMATREGSGRERERRIHRMADEGEWPVIIAGEAFIRPETERAIRIETESERERYRESESQRERHRGGGRRESVQHLPQLLLPLRPSQRAPIHSQQL